MIFLILDAITKIKYINFWVTFFFLKIVKASTLI